MRTADGDERPLCRHLTLTGRVAAAEVDRAARALRALYRAHVPPGVVPIGNLALFRQRPGERFRITRRALFLGEP